MSTPLWGTTARGDSVGIATIEADDDTLTLAAHGLVNGQQVTVASLTGGATSVLVADAPYFVANTATNTFQLRPSPGAPPMAFGADGGCTVYQVAGLLDAQTLRNAFAGLLTPGNSSTRFVSRTGVFPVSTETQHVTTAGMTWTVADIIAAVRHSTGGIYIIPHPSESGPITAADPSQGRIDALDLQIQDHTLDSSGFVRGRIVYTAGTPGAIPVAPTVTANSERLTTWTVAAGATSTGTPTTPQFAVSRGGVLPVTDSSQYPTTGGRYKGLALYDISLQSLLVNTTAGSTWEPVGSTKGFQFWQTIVYDANGTFVKANYPGLRAVRIRCQGGGGAGGGAAITGAGSSSGGGGGQGGNYAEKWVLVAGLGASETVTRGAGGTGVSGAAGNNGGQSAVGTLCVAGGGVGGQTSGSTSAWSGPISATPSATATGDMVRLGDPGGFGVMNGSADFIMSGYGGGSMWGIGGRPVNPGAGANGFDASGYGGGGGGAANSNSQAAAATGGNGTAGRVLIDLYV
jgi:hypothetical protein